MQRTGIRVELDVEPSLGRLDRGLEIALFRVVQEGLATVHVQGIVSEIQIKIGAAATNVFVEIAGHSAGKILSAEVLTAQRGSGNSMTLLRHRILEMGGLFELESLCDGMVLRVAVPRKALVAQACD
jgi:signal transduction histidine kinase